MAEARRTVSFLLTVRDGLTGTLRGIVNTLNTIRDAGQKVNSAFAPLQSTLFNVAAGFAGIAAARKGFDAAEKQVNAEQRLAVALKGNTALLERRLDVAKRIQKETTFADQDVIEAEALLRTFGVGDAQIDTALKAVYNRAAAYNTDLLEQARQIGVTFATGLTGELGEREAEVRNLGETGLKTGQQFDILATKYDGFAKKLAATDFGRIQQQNNLIGDVFERLGRVFARLQVAVLPRVLEVFDRFVGRLESPAGKAFLDRVASVLDFLVRNAETILYVLLALRGVSAVASAVAVIATVLGGIVSLLGLILNPVGLLVVAGIALGGFVLDAGIGLERVWQILQNAIRTGGVILGQISEGKLRFKDLLDFILTEVKALALEVGKDFVPPILRGLTAGLQFIRPVIVGFLNLIKDLVFAILNALGEVVAFFGGNLQPVLDSAYRDANKAVAGLDATMQGVAVGASLWAGYFANGTEEAKKLREENQKVRDQLVDDTRVREAAASRRKEAAEYNDLLKERAALQDKLAAAEARKPVVSEKERLEQDERNLEASYREREITVADYLDRKDALETKGQEAELKRLRDTIAKAKSLRDELLAKEEALRLSGAEPDQDLGVDINKTYADEIAALERVKVLEGQLLLIREEQENRRKTSTRSLGEEIRDITESGLGAALGKVVTDFRSARQAAADFFKGVAADLANLAGKIAAAGIVRSIFGGGKSGPFAALFQIPTGFNEGGAVAAGVTPGEAVVAPGVARRLGRPLLAAMNALAVPARWLHDLVAGGFVPGGGPDADTAAGVLPLGGYVLRRRAVDLYGRGLLSRLFGFNLGGPVPDGAFRAGLGLPPIPSPALRSYSLAAEGAGGRDAGAPVHGRGRGGTTVAVVPRDEQSLDRLLRGGDNALVDALGRNREAIRSMLGL